MCESVDDHGLAANEVNAGENNADRLYLAMLSDDDICTLNQSQTSTKTLINNGYSLATYLIASNVNPVDSRATDECNTNTAYMDIQSWPKV